MEHRTLGRTGIEVSVMGLGGGGASCLGLKTGGDEAHAADVVKSALDLGINHIDTAEGYGTEEAIGKGIQGVARDSVVLSTKKSSWQKISPAEVEAGLEDSLRRLRTDYIDVYHLHGVSWEDYGYLSTRVVPQLERFKTQGKIRAIAISEGGDYEHTVLDKALDDDFWDVIMVVFNFVNQSARYNVLKKAIQKNMGVQVMCANKLAMKPVAISDHTAMMGYLKELSEENQFYFWETDDEERPLDFLINEGHAESLAEAAYLYARDEPGVTTVLSGTSRVDHLECNARIFEKQPLPDACRAKLELLFRKIGRPTM